MGYFKKIYEGLSPTEHRAIQRGSPGCGTGHCRCGGRTYRGRWYPCNVPTPKETER